MFILNPYRYSAPANLLLDTYSGAAAAYSLRKLRTAYSGSAIRVRRSSDNTEQDIGFDGNGNLNETDLMSHVGYQNLLQYSEQFDNAYWTKNQCSISSNATTAPDGTVTADKILENGLTAQNPYVTLNYGPYSGTYTASVYLKAGERNYGLIDLYLNSIDYSILIDLTTGAVVANLNNPLVYSITNAGNGWWRLAISATRTSGDVNFTFGGKPSAAYGTFNTTSNYGIYAWGAQLNTGSLQTYQQTTSIANPGSGYVTKWYDQSGNGRDAAQSTSANQPRIVNAGTVEKQNTKAALNYYSTTSLRTTFSYNSTQPFHIFQLFKNTKSIVSSVSYIFDFDNGVLQRPAMFYETVSNGGLAIYAGNVLSANDSISKNVINSTLFNNSNSNIYINNSQSASGLSGNYSPVGYYVIGDRYTNSGYNFQGYFSEIVIYLSDKSSNRAGIESNMNSYYSIY